MRKQAINVECQVDQLSIEAADWLAFHVGDLAWIQRRWRIWESPAEYEELDSVGQATWRFNKRHGVPIERRMVKRSVDVVRFASKRDAMYFKLMFL